MTAEGNDDFNVMPMEHLCRLLLLLAFILPLTGHAVTLGQARVNSFLGQPLDAEIDLIGLTAGQHEDLRLRIANERHFERMGIVYQRQLTELQFDVVRSGRQWLVRARTEKPITEPFIDFPLQMTWPGGQMIRQYTLLLDPPKRVRKARVSGGAPTTATQRPTPLAGNSYGPVRNGETLWPIAQALKPAGITTRQMAMALLRANPQAFVDNNINRLRAGATLTIPSRGVIEELDAAAARAEFNAQISAQRRKSPPVATSPRDLQGTADPASSDTAGAIEAAPSNEPTKPDDADAQLRIVADQRKVEAGSDKEEDLREQLLVTMEEIESNRLTTGAIASRLARLESELEQMQKLVELKDAQIAALQSEVSSREAVQDAVQQRQQAAPATTKQMPPEMQPPKSGMATSPKVESAPAVDIPAEQIVPTADAEPSARLPWYEEYLWAIWAALALLGLAAVLLMFRRPNPAAEELPLAELPEVRNSTPPYAAAGAADSRGLRREQRSFQAVAQEPPPGIKEIAIDETELPELDIPVARVTREDIDGGASGPLIDDIVDDSRLLIDRPQADATTPGYSDDDIASWIKELGTEAERGSQDAHAEQVQGDDDVPSLLTELDDRLASTPSEGLSDTGGTQPSEDDGEDETFAMSLDLARAYLEIGDHEGARDMLQQALAGARSPTHRRQIEELLQQID